MIAIARFLPEYIPVRREWRGRKFCFRAKWLETWFIYIYAKHQ